MVKMVRVKYWHIMWGQVTVSKDNIPVNATELVKIP